MRVKKQKRHRRAVRFFVAVFGFREPFRVICDGTFIHHLIINNIVPADKAISNILGGTVKLFTTRCVMGELKRMGSSYSDSLQVAQELILVRCDHERMKSAEACLTDVIGENNLGHFFVATQDADLRAKLRGVPGVPLIYALRNAVLLESPSEFQQQFSKNTESQRSYLSQVEQKLLKGKLKGVVDEEESQHSEDHGTNFISKPIKKKDTLSRGLGIKDGPQFKKKKAKAPNPLSVKKKQKKNPITRDFQSLKDKVNSGRQRKRKRKYNHQANEE